MMELYIPFSF